MGTAAKLAAECLAFIGKHPRASASGRRSHASAEFFFASLRVGRPSVFPRTQLGHEFQVRVRFAIMPCKVLILLWYW
jgi:hypothetical protein